MTMPIDDWSDRLAALIGGVASAQRPYSHANAQAVQHAVDGRGPDSPSADADAGVRMVVNMAAVHVPAFCKASGRGSGDRKPYKNGYDRGTYSRIGEAGKPAKTRVVVDMALPIFDDDRLEDVYFGAIELNGCGIRFYGDVCLVLKREAVHHETIILDRNSYDLVREPVAGRVKSHPRGEAIGRKEEARRWSGLWARDKGTMAALKVLEAFGPRSRRLTTGQVSEALRSDEDYMEVLKIGSFGAADLQEVRIGATDAAHDALAGDRLAHRPTPRLEALMSRYRRSEAERALRDERVRVRVVTTQGRTKE